MKETKLLPDDPRLTAYALGELAGDDRAAVEAALRQNPALRRLVDEIRATSAQLESALADEPLLPDSTPPFGPTIFKGPPAPALGSRDRLGAEARPRRGRREYAGYDGTARDKVLKFPQSYFVIAGIAAACFAVIVAWYRENVPVAERASPGFTRIATTSDDHRLRQKAIQLELAPEPAPRFLPESLALIDRPRRNPEGDSRASDAVALAQPADATPAATPPAPETAVRTDVPASPVAPASTTSTVVTATAAIPVANDPPAGGLTSEPGNIVASATPTFTTPQPLPAFGSPGATTTFSRNGSAASLGSSVLRADDDPVVLDTVTVLGTRTTAFARERGSLPPPPPGAQFGRNPNPRAEVRDNAFRSVLDERHSTFSADVDTAGYSHLRRLIERGQTPTRDAVRIEQMLNYFPFAYAAPRGNDLFAASLEVAEAPWAPKHRLVRIGLKAREVSVAGRPAANLVFLIDVSASMEEPNKLPLIKESMRLLVGKLRPDDRVAIVTYAGNGGLVLGSTPVARAREILRALETLTPRPSGSRSSGLQLAYEAAEAGFMKEGINRVILCTDGDFSLGPTSDADLMRLIGEKAGRDVYLTVLGFGMDNGRDGSLERLAQRGNGHYGYIDSRREAEKLLVEQVSSTLVTIAKDVKIDVEFNPARVASYRLIGYENRLLNRDDFDDDTVDAGEIGAGQTLTALYEIVPVAAAPAHSTLARSFTESRYSSSDAFSSRLVAPSGYPNQDSDELLMVRVRHKRPSGFASAFTRTLDFAVSDRGVRFEQASADFRFAAAVAQFGMMLRNSPYRGTATFGDVIAWAANAATRPADDPGGYRGEFIDLVRKAQVLLQ